MTADILVIGDVMTDVIVRPHGPLLRGSDRAATIRSMPGGSGANQAAWIGHLGGRVAFAGRVGAADAGAQAAELRRHGVVPHLAADDELPTGRLVTLLDPDGERSFLTDRGANAALCRDDFPDALLEGVRLLHISGYSLFAEAPRAAVLEFAAAAGRRGVPVTFDAGSAGFLAETGAERFLAWTHGADTLFANAAEADALAGCADPAGQFARLAPHYQTVVIKRGAAGADAAARHGPIVAAAAASLDATDTTGAGDAFLAAFLLVRLAGGDLHACLAAGVRHGTIAAGLLGGRPPVA